MRHALAALAVVLVACSSSPEPPHLAGSGGSSTSSASGAGGSSVVSTTGQGGGATSTSSSATSVTTGQGGAGGAAPECVTPDDCPGADTECSSRTCQGGVCGVVQAKVGAPCAGGVCDSSGACVENLLVRCLLDDPDHSGIGPEATCGVGTSSWSIDFKNITCQPDNKCRIGAQVVPCFCPSGTPCKVWTNQYLTGVCE